MIKIDWRMAPEWADGHGLISWQGFTEVWINADQYAVVGREGGPYPWGGGAGDTKHNHKRGQVEYITPRPDRWDGEGLPPVGTVCEWHPSVHGWVEVTILGHDGEDTWYRVKGEDHAQTCRNMTFFRPIRTPEQIAAEERKKIEDEIQDICTDAENSGKPYFKALYDAGYRKQEVA